MLGNFFECLWPIHVPIITSEYYNVAKIDMLCLGLKSGFPKALGGNYIY